MYDSWGDGWNGATISALDCAGNTVLGPLTLEDGNEAIVSLCLNLDQAGALLPGATVVAGGGSGNDVYPPVIYVVDVENAVDFNSVLEP